MEIGIFLYLCQDKSHWPKRLPHRGHSTLLSGRRPPFADVSKDRKRSVGKFHNRGAWIVSVLSVPKDFFWYAKLVLEGLAKYPLDHSESGLPAAANASQIPLNLTPVANRPVVRQDTVPYKVGGFSWAKCQRKNCFGFAI